MTAQAQEAPTTSPEATKSQDLNLANMRKQIESERAEKAQMQAKIKELEQLTLQRQEKNNDDDDDVVGDPYIDPRTLKKKLAKLEQSIDEKIDRKATERAREMMEEEKRNSYLKSNQDFDQIMSEEVIATFAKKCPGMADAILRMPDNFERQKLVYEAIKTTGSHKKEEARPSIQETIDKNRKGIFYSPSGVGTAPYASVGDFSESGQKNAYSKMKELQKTMRLG